MIHAVEQTNLADLLERILDKGVVIAGDIHVKLVEVELLTIQLRLVICSVDKACELGLDWWNRDARLTRNAAEQDPRLRIRRTAVAGRAGGGQPRRVAAIERVSTT